MIRRIASKPLSSSSMIQAIFEFLFTALLRILIALLAIPISSIVLTPFVLIRARRQPGAYWGNVLAGYKKIAAWCLEHLIFDFD